MYSVVLLAAVTTSEAAPQHGFKKGYFWGACYGGCYGVGYTGYPGPLFVAGGWGLPYGCYFAGYGGYGACAGHAGFAAGAEPAMVLTPPTGYAPLGEASKPAEKKKTDENNQQVKARAQVTFELPKGATLYVDDVPIANADDRKQFRTPPLRRGEEYYYELRAELVRDGKTLTQTRRITLWAGDSIKADFSSLGQPTGVASADDER
jgi:uncharacterized protein (TIGR03000 family)